MTANGSVIKELEVIRTVIKRENRHVAYPEDININPSFSVVLLRHRRSSAVLSCSNNNRWSRDREGERGRRGEERRGGPSSSFSDPLSLMEVKTRPATVLICSIQRGNSLLHLLLIHKLCEEKLSDSTQELDSCFSCRSAQQTLFFLAVELKVRISLRGKLCWNFASCSASVLHFESLFSYLGIFVFGARLCSLASEQEAFAQSWVSLRNWSWQLQALVTCLDNRWRDSREEDGTRFRSFLSSVDVWCWRGGVRDRGEQTQQDLNSWSFLEETFRARIVNLSGTQTTRLWAPTWAGTTLWWNQTPTRSTLESEGWGVGGSCMSCAPWRFWRSTTWLRTGTNRSKASPPRLRDGKVVGRMGAPATGAGGRPGPGIEWMDQWTAELRGGGGEGAYATSLTAGGMSRWGRGRVQAASGFNSWKY